MNLSPPKPEFSRTVAVAELPRDGLTLEITATAVECQALAQRFDLIGIDGLRAAVAIRPVHAGRLIRVDGEVEAIVVQTCVVTLEPVRNAIKEGFVAVFGERDEAAPVRELDLDFDADEEDDPEPIEGGRIDIGELAAQHLALALDPYPRVPGAEFPATGLDAAASEAATPFGALARLSQRS